MTPHDATQSDDPDEDAPTLIEGALREELTRALDERDLMEATRVPSTLPSGAPADPHAWFLGRSFGGFRIVCALASGGMATVFLARKEGPARVSKYAAIKVVHPHLAFERDFINMFLDEARIAALLDHPNVCRVLDFGMAEGTYYLAMEYLLGETWSAVRAALAEHPDAARIVPAISAYVLSQACEGLHAAHEGVDEHGRPLHIVHRDVSPQNIFVAYDGTVRVLDFGIARAADRITSTRDGTLKGRLAYMSPEQMTGQEVGATADLWSMGVILREALEGKRLFRRVSDAETMLAVTHEPLPEWAANVPPRLRAIADRALTREPLERFASAHEMATELWRFAQSGRAPVSSSELSAWMALLFSHQLEQKRALLQLPIPSVSDVALPWPSLPPPEPSASTSLSLRGPSTVPARGQGRSAGATLRPRWVNAAALLALAVVGALAGVFAARTLRRRPETGRAASAVPSAEPMPSVTPLPMEEPAAHGRTSAAQAPRAEPTPGPTPRAAQPVPEQEPERPSAEPRRHRERPDQPDALLARGTARFDAARPEPAQAAPRPSPAPEGPTTASGARSRSTGEQGDAAGGPSGVVAVAFEGGWAEVYLGPRLLGTTPGRFTLPVGKHTLTIKPFGSGKPLAKRVEVAAGGTQKLFLGAASL